MGRARPRRRRRAPLSQQVERWGHAILTRAWTWLVRGVSLAMAPVVALARAIWLWLRNQTLAVQVVFVLLLVGSVGFAHSMGWRQRLPVYAMDDVEALARVIRSEIGTGTVQQRLHVAWATRNLAAERGQSISAMACAPCGPQELGRPVSSRQQALESDRVLARLVIDADPMLDPTGGASHFLNPALQDQLARRQIPGYAGRPYHKVRRIWSQRYGWEPYYRLGNDLELWGRKR
jgi:hypothetical protein